MLKKSITYEDFEGNVVEEDFFFHLSKAELVKLEMSHHGGLEASLERIMRANDGKAIMDEFENILLLTCGRRSDDGRRFIKNDQIREDFLSSGAYSVLFMELVTDAGKAAEFIAGVIPKDLAEEAAKIAGADLKVVETEREEPKEKPEPRILTRKEFLEMPADELEVLAPKIASGEIILKRD